ncbi:DUF2975 domain-containing protein [Sanguibacter sp. 25GB23B1]|uniref:DUF2975 domain-containing protein n=1 Tax=unclassified Sanguibacter TaxID=2645534 RepID=UPI0032AF9A2F
MDQISTTAARTALTVLLLGSVLAQALLPQLAAELGGGDDEVAHLVIPYAVAGVVAIVCVQAALVAVWQLLTLVSRDEILTVRSLQRVDALRVLLGLGAAVAAGPMVHLLGVVGVGGPGVVLALAACLVCGVTTVLLLGVARQVLERAVANHRALDAVERPGDPAVRR